MKKIGILLCVILLVLGCSRSKEEKIVLRIGDIAITQQEFENAYEALQFVPEEMPPRKAFLDRYVARKLILSEAEKMGLDKDPAFLQDVQIFWEQTLLKMTLARKMKELAAQIDVSDQEVRAIYDKHKEKMYSDKEFSEVYSQIKWSLLKAKQNQALVEWISSLKNGKTIKVDYKALGIEPEE
jgi:hypothetical protein